MTPKDPRLSVLLQNLPGNIMERLDEFDERLLALETEPAAPYEQITGGRLIIADLIVSPANSVTTTDPTSTDYTGSFTSGEGIEFDGSIYVTGNVVNGVLKTGFTDTGTLYAIDANIEGVIVIAPGSEAGGWIIDSSSIHDAAGSVGLSSAVTGGDDIRFWAGSVTPATAPFKVTEAGVLTSTLGFIGGWTIGSTSLTDTAGSVGMSSAVTGGDDIRFWAGSVTPSSAPFKVTEAGVLTSTSGFIGGWQIGSNFLRDGTQKVGLSSADTGADDIRIWAGDTTAAIAPFRVTESGALVATSATISGSITATTGFIGGWTIDSTRIYSLASNIGIAMDSSVPAIKVGNLAGDYIIIDGANQRIRSSNFVAGAMGSNWATATGDLEVNNLVARGELRTFLLTSSNQMAVSGSIIVSKDAGKTAAAVADSDTTIDFGKSMTVGDWVKFQGADANGSNSTEWLLVGSNVSGTTYNVTRNVDGTGANDWADATPFVVIGAEGDSRIELVAGATASLQLITQNSTWDSYIVQASMSTVEGAITAGGDSLLLNADGILVNDGGDALVFYDSSYSSYSIFSFKPNYDGGRSTLRQLVFTVDSETNQISNGDFETGDFTSWTEVDTGTNISVEAGEGYQGGYACKFANTATASDYIQQNLASTGTTGVIVRFRARTLGDGAGASAVYLQNATDAKYVEVPTNDWRNFYEILPSSTAYIKISIPSTSGTVYIDDINIRNLNTATSVTPASHISVQDGISQIVGGNGVRFTVGWTANPFMVDMTTAGVVFNFNNGNYDFRIAGDTDANNFFSDASTDRIGIGTATPSQKLDVVGSVNVSTGSTYKVNGATVLSGTVTGVTNGDSHDHIGGDGAAITEGAITLSDVTTLNASTSAHGFLLKATAPASGLMNFVGIGNGETVYANKPLFDNTNPAALGSVGPGTQVIAARRDHIHANPALDTLAAPTDITTLNASTSTHGLLLKATAPASGLMNFVGLTNGETVYSNKPLFDTTNPADLGSAGPGTQVIAARRDHIHANPALDTLAAPTDITTLNASTSTHGLLLKATAPASGLINYVGIGNGETVYANKALFDNTNPAAIGTAAPGTQVIAARRDHVHALPSDVTYGTYTPSLTGVTNVAASGAFECQYIRVGNTVTVGGKVTVDPTTNSISTELGISLPIASNIGAAEDVAGTAVSPAVASECAAIEGDATNDRANMRWICVSAANHVMMFTFTYQII